MNTRFCSQCNQEKPLGEFDISEFDINKTKPFGRAYRCKECRRKYDREHPRRERGKDPQRIASTAKWHQSEHGKEMARKSRARRFASNKERYKTKEMIEKEDRMLKTEVHFSGNPCNGMTEEVHFMGESPNGTVVCYAVVKCTITDCLSSYETAVVEVILREFGALRVAKVV